MPTASVSTTLADGTLTVQGLVLFTGVSPAVTLDAAQPELGCFLRAGASADSSRWTAALGTAPSALRYTCTFRPEPFWMKPQAGSDCASVPVETQWLMLELAHDRVALVVPLIDAPFRTSLAGKDGALHAVVESGDPQVVGRDALALFVAVGEDPLALCVAGARVVRARLTPSRLRTQKPLPRFADLFGWCTWDAFYQDVTPGRVREGLESFALAGVRPRMMILDDGWQSERTMPTGERRLTGFPANSKFPGDLASTVRMAKEEFGIETFLVWHAFHGYWGGVDGSSLPGYSVREVARSYGPGILAMNPAFNLEWWGALVGLVPPEAIQRFYHDYHRHLRAQGVDGVKVDNQASQESVAAGSGGRVRLMEAYREALESSVALHFGGNLINCMSCANEMFYTCEASTLTRTSTDFWPKLPASHGMHLYTNAQVGAWFGEFCWPDWDMFQSGHAMGAFHAAGRAVSGAPVYVSDKPGAHDSALLRKLVYHDGTTARAQVPGRPSRDCLFHDPTREAVLLKIVSRNATTGVVGAFHARYQAEPALAIPITGEVSPSDIPELPGERFAVYAHSTRTLTVVARAGRIPVTLAPLTAEVFTVAAIEQDLAVIGLADHFNSGAAVLGVERTGDTASIRLRDGGEVVCYTSRPLRRANVDGVELGVHALGGAGIRIQLPRHGAQTLHLHW